MTRKLETDLGHLGEVERALLRHIGEHRFTVPLVLERLFRMNAAALERLLTPLVRQPAALIGVDRLLGTDTARYSLTQLGVRTLQHLGEGHAGLASGPGSDQAAKRSLAMLWYCCMGKQRKQFLGGSAVRERYGDLLPSSPHALLPSSNKETLERLYVPSPRMLASDVARHVSLDLTRRALAKPEVRAWIARGRYRIVILVDNDARLAELQSAIERRLLDASVPVHYERIECAANREATDAA